MAPRSPERRKAATRSANTPWSEEELLQSVEVYVLLLRLQIQGMDGRTEPVAQTLLRGPLALRNDAAIRYRMRNISAVARELGAPVLADFSPAESVGSGVRLRIREMLQADPDFARLLLPSRTLPGDARADALKALRILRQHVETLERDLSQRGHNQPPEPVDEIGIKPAQYREALRDVDILEVELAKDSPDRPKVEASRARLVRLALALAKWAGERATKFTDEALKYAAPIVAAKVTGLLPLLVNAAEAIAHAIGH